MHRVLCSTGTMIGRPNGRNWRLLAPCREKLRCDGLEFLMYDTWYPEAEEIAGFVKNLGLPVPVMHCEKHIGESISRRENGDWEEALRQFETNCQMAAFLGAEKMVMHLWDGVTSDQYFSNNLEMYGTLKEIARRHGVFLTIENVVCNQQDPLTHWRELMDRDPEVRFTFDTKMAAFHDELLCMYEPQNRDLWAHIAHLHINDYGGGYMDWANLKTLHVGEGKLNFARFFSFVDQCAYQGDFTVEATSFLPDGVIHWDDLNRTFDRIRSYLKKEK